MKVNTQTYTPGTVDKNDTSDIFPRCQHPDKRSDREALEAIHLKLGIYRKRESPRGMSVICLNTGREFSNITLAAKKYDIHYSNLLRHLKGEIPMVKKLRFRYL